MLSLWLLAAPMSASLSDAAPGARELAIIQAAAAASPRPAACGSGRDAGVWSRAGDPTRARWCRELARGFAALELDPAAARRHAEIAQRLRPGHSAGVLLEARALAACARPKAAWRVFAHLKERARVTAAPAALHDYALAARRTGNRRQALEAYRQLVPQVHLMADRFRQHRAYVEAALTSMELGSEGVLEAIAYLSEARNRTTPPTVAELALGALALALDRAGRDDEALGVARESGGPWFALTLTDDSASELAGEDGAQGFEAEVDAVAEEDGVDGQPASEPETDHEEAPTEDVPWAERGADPQTEACSSQQKYLPFVKDHELHAIIAVLARPFQEQLAREHWEEYLRLAPKDDPWRAHAQAELEGDKR